MMRSEKVEACCKWAKKRTGSRSATNVLLSLKEKLLTMERGSSGVDERDPALRVDDVLPDLSRVASLMLPLLGKALAAAPGRVRLPDAAATPLFSSLACRWTRSSFLL